MIDLDARRAGQTLPPCLDPADLPAPLGCIPLQGIARYPPPLCENNALGGPTRGVAAAACGTVGWGGSFFWWSMMITSLL